MYIYIALAIADIWMIMILLWLQPKTKDQRYHLYHNLYTGLS